MRVANLKRDRDEVLAHIHQRFDRLENMMATEHEKTRRHIDMVAESLREYVKKLADGISASEQR